MLRAWLSTILFLGAAFAEPPRLKMLSQTWSLVAWSDDGASALLRVDEEESDGSVALGYSVQLRGQPVAPQFLLASGRRVPKSACASQATALAELLGRLGFGLAHVEPSRCGDPTRVVQVGDKATALVKASFLAPRSEAGGGPWFEAGDRVVKIGRGDRVEASLLWFGTAKEVKRIQVALSPSRRMLLNLWCSPTEVCKVDAFCSTKGAIAELSPNEDEPVAAAPPTPAQRTPATTTARADEQSLPRDLDQDRAWWDGSSKTPRSPVGVSFDPEGQHPYSCVREDGAYWTYLAEDTGIRVARGGRISERDGNAVGTIDKQGALQMRDTRPVRVDDAGRLFCGNAARAFARVDRRGIITREAGGERLGALHGEVDWRSDRRAAFLLLVDVCRIAAQ